MQIIQSRRDFLASASLAAARRASSAPRARSPTRRRRRRPRPAASMIPICVAPWYVAEELLRAEGFTDIRYVHVQAGRAGRR